MTKLLYETKLNSDDMFNGYIRSIPFNEFQNIKYLAKGSFSEVQKAEWIGHGYWSNEGYVEKEAMIF
jgi:hypothetical protein